MLKSFSTKAKLMSMPVVYFIIVLVSAIMYTYYDNKVTFRVNQTSQADNFIKQVLKGRITVYQFLRSPSEENAQKVVESFAKLDKEVLEAKKYLTEKESIEIADAILEESKNYINYFDQFSVKRIEEFKNGIEKESDDLKPILSNMVNTGVNLEKNLSKISEIAISLKDEAQATLRMILIAIAIGSNILFIIFSVTLSNIIINTLNKFKNGLSEFFAFVNKETDDSSLLDIEGNDEFAQMAKEVNESINKTKNGLIKDNETVKEVLSIVEQANKGYLNLEVKSVPNNPQLVQLASALNNMLKGIKVNIDSVNVVLKEYSNYNFTSKLSESGIEGDMASLIKSVNFITEEISALLKNSFVIGLTLDESSDQLIVNVDTLNKSSTEAAASLEETAAALEEITSTIVNNAENVQSMSDYARKLSESAKTGQQQAQNTSSAMEDITEQVNSISEAITVIDQIAFQTNILSLNAAVEAATAGEAGKGFAVVAQEVRNLAARSAEAAKEIKELVENATSKATHGKEISSHMIKGYDELLENITKSTEKIAEIANASKEQEQGITQINDAVTQLDQQTQQNALIASQTHDIAIETDAIAKEIVSDAKSKEFLGKNDAKARDNTSHHVSDNKRLDTKIQNKPKEISKVKKELPSSTTKKETQKVITAQNHNEDEWESF